MKGLLLVTVTAFVFGAVVAQGQENPQKPAASSNSFSESAPDTRELTSATTSGQQRFISGVNAAAAVQKDYPAAQAHGNLVDPKSGCALSALAAIAADSIYWSGKCEGGLASGAGTVSFYNDGRFSQSLTAEFEKGFPRDGRGMLVWVDGARYEGGLEAALVMDTSLAGKNVDHDFRWVACGGGAGEVVVHLDGVDPPVGRCTKRGTT